MKCNRAQELFSSYLENTIQPPMGVALEQHLAECDRCKAEYGRFHATTVVLDELPEVEPPADLHAMIMARVEEARRTAPSRIKWWNIDWQSALTVRVPAKALAGVTAALVAFVALAQFGPLHTVTASFLGGQRAGSQPTYDTTTVPVPLPQGFKPDSGMQYVAVGSGLSIGIRVDSTSASSTVYMMRLATPSKTPVQVEVSMLPSGRGSGETAIYKGFVSVDREAAKPVEVTQGGSGPLAEVAVVKWTHQGRTVEEYIFLPSAFGSANQQTGVSISGEGTFHLLNQLSAICGAVILVPGSLTDSAETVSVQSKTASDAIAQASRQAQLASQMVGSSVYILK